MRGLTIKQPWAWAICFAGKRIENRSRPIPAKLVGQRVAIHAGTGTASAAFQLDSPPAAVRAWAKTVEPLRNRCIVATAVLAGSDGDPTDAWAIPGRCHWRLEDVVVLREPVPVARGQLGLWRLDPETETRVRAAEQEARG